MNGESESAEQRSYAVWISGILFWTYTTALFLGTHAPPKQVEGIIYNDKLLHFIAYAGLSFFWMTWRQSLNKICGRSYLFALIGLSLFGAFDESTQLLVNRNATLYDWICDFTGICIGLILFRVVQPLVKKIIAP